MEGITAMFRVTTTCGIIQYSITMLFKLLGKNTFRSTAAPASFI